MYVSSKEACEFYSVSIQTLRRWDKSGKIDTIKTDGGHRRYKINNFPTDIKKGYIYARVSSSKQKEDLERQVKYIKNRYPDYKVITDIASGLNFNRRGLQTILDELFKGNIQELVVYSNDRLTRFGIETYQYMFQKLNSKLTVLHNLSPSNRKSEISDDIISIITYFTAKYHGSRKYVIDTKN